MEVFGDEWKGYVETIKKDWLEKVGENDLVLLSGDISWAMTRRVVRQQQPDARRGVCRDRRPRQVLPKGQRQEPRRRLGPRPQRSVPVLTDMRHETRDVV